MEQNNLCIKCKTQKKINKNMCGLCKILEKREVEPLKKLYKCVFNKCQNTVEIPESDCEKCMEYPKQFLLEENYNKKSRTKAIDKKCIYRNCYCCKNGDCVRLQMIGSLYCKNCYIKIEREKQGLYTCSNIDKCKNILLTQEYFKCDKCRKLDEINKL